MVGDAFSHQPPPTPSLARGVLHFFTKKRAKRLRGSFVREGMRRIRPSQPFYVPCALENRPPFGRFSKRACRPHSSNHPHIPHSPTGLPPTLYLDRSSSRPPPARFLSVADRASAVGQKIIKTFLKVFKKFLKTSKFEVLNFKF